LRSPLTIMDLICSIASLVTATDLILGVAC
jgi:hypothetical protein